MPTEPFEAAAALGPLKAFQRRTVDYVFDRFYDPENPAYQFLVNTGSLVHRSIPDVSLMMGGCPGDADLAKQDCTQLPRSAAIVWIGGRPALLIGTSSSSPASPAPERGCSGSNAP